MTWRIFGRKGRGASSSSGRFFVQHPGDGLLDRHSVALDLGRLGCRRIQRTGPPVEHIHTGIEEVKQFGHYLIPERQEGKAFRSLESVSFAQWVRRYGLVI